MIEFLYTKIDDLGSRNQQFEPRTMAEKGRFFTPYSC